MKIYLKFNLKAIYQKTYTDAVTLKSYGVEVNSFLTRIQHLLNYLYDVF